MMKYKIFYSLFFLLQLNISSAQIIKNYTLKLNSVCSGEDALLVISGHEVPGLLGSSINKLSLLSFLRNKKQFIVLQVDQKDPQGRYNFNNTKAENFLGAQDELVFRRKDIGKRLSSSSELLKQYSVIEIKIISEQANTEDKAIAGWIYIVRDTVFQEDMFPTFNKRKKSLLYNVQQDLVISSIYKIAFSKDKPFLVNAFHWRLPEPSADIEPSANVEPEPSINEPEQAQWSPDITDTMKIRHTGNFFGFPFKRTDDDYYSQLLDVKSGPLRIIRRTENKVKVFWKLKSPALYIDYVMMPNGFVMDSMIDIPFNISLFFSELTTISTIDWNNAPDRPLLTIKPGESFLSLPVNGLPTEDKKNFNQIADTEFSLSSQSGQFDVSLLIADDFPIHSQLFLRDDLHEIDLPENYPGQFGNVGFKTSGWENIDSKLSHLKFTVCVDRM